VRYTELYDNPEPDVPGHSLLCLEMRALVLYNVLMNQTLRIAIVADYKKDNRYHIATNESIVHAARSLNIPAEPIWLDTDTLDTPDAEDRFRSCDGIWCGTGSPFRSMEGALRSIRFAREQGWPFIGT
jgi:CTP synthase (UTP-ammonia lyase)